MKPFGIVYLLIDGTNDREYVGQTIFTVEKRFKIHAKADTYIGHVIRARGGEDLFATAILKVCYSKAELDFWEKYFIKARNTKAPNGYNLTDGGEGTSGWHHNPETLVKMSKARKGKKYKPRSPEHCAKLSATRKGKTLSPEHAAKIAAALTGVQKSPEHVAKVAAANTGKKRSPKARAKMSAAHKGQKRSAEAIAKTVASNTGKKRTPEQRAKIAAALTGVPKSAEHRTKIGEAQRGKKRGPRSPEVKEKISASNTGKKRSTEARAKMSAAHTGKKQSAEQRAKIATAVHSRSKFKNLVAELDARHMSYKDLSELMGKEKSYISRRMSERQAFNDDDKNRLVEIFNKPIEYLLQRDDS